MARTKDDLLADLENLGTDSQQPAPAPTRQQPSNTTTTTITTSGTAVSGEDNDDVFGEITKQLAAKPAAPSTASRPTTPHLSSSTTSGASATKSPPKHTPASSSGRNSEEDRATLTRVGGGRTSGETAARRNEAAEAAPSSGGGGASGGWGWGSLSSLASAAVKQANSLAKEISGNEEAQRWATQVRGNFAGLQSFSTDLRSKALPTFTSLLQHIAPPISAHERLQIHTTHDLRNYPSLDPLIYTTFSRVMAQVEGGELLVLQRGSEQQGYRGSVLGGAGGGGGGGSAGWTDGPWWRDDTRPRDLGVVGGLRAGTRLARVSAEAFAREFFDARGGVEQAAKLATQTLSETNPVRSSDIFLAIQAVSYPADAALFADDARQEQQQAPAGGGGGGVVDPADAPEDLVAFAVHLHDPIHSLAFSTLSQPFPQRWAGWLDATPTSNPDSTAAEPGLPESIVEIIQTGGVDPREWVAEWMSEILGLAVGVVAQRYVARRMGVGEGGLGRGKRRMEEEGLGGEAARAL